MSFNGHRHSFRSLPGVSVIARSRILFFNWAPFDAPRRLGLGVSVYLRNLFGELCRRGDTEIVFVSSGVRYSVNGTRCFYRETGNVLSEQKLRSFEIVNSPVRAPGWKMFLDADTWRTDETCKDVFRSILQEQGPFDAVHFHNLEGISSAVFELRSEFPQTRFFHTWHNYIPLCPQVHLLHKKSEQCEDYRHGTRCVGCTGPLLDLKAMRVLDALNPLAARSKTPRHPDLSPRDTAKSEPYRRWRERNLELLNDGIDGTIAVSDVARDTVVSLGIRPETVTVVPLGMDVHCGPDEMRAAFAAKPKRDLLTFSFVGYRDPSKGLPMLAEAVARAGDSGLKQLADLIVVAKLGARDRNRYAKLNRGFRKVTFIDGYDRPRLREIAAMTDVNIVPSIWRETFNQVGYELMCFGTPSLISDSVGLSMFYRDKPDFIFESGNHGDLARKMHALAQDRSRVESFWDEPVELPSMQDHASRLLDVLLGSASASNT